MRVVFIVQVEGRGHMTQAISMQEILEKAGHEIILVLCGTSPQREIPDFFSQHFKDKLTLFISPNLLKDRDNKSIKLGASLSYNLRRIPLYIRQCKLVNSQIKCSHADLIINFHEILTGVWYFLNRPNIPIISVAHQYIYTHNRFYYPKLSFFQKLSLELVNKIATLGSKKKFGINFSQWENQKWDKLVIIPPLIREKVKKMTIENKGHLLIYLLNPGYAEEIIQWHRNHPHVEIHCFWDKKEADEEVKHSNNLSFHRLNAEKFVHFLASCKGLATTAGYESVCEAMYLGKPVLMVPVKNHPEQYINAVLARFNGAGIKSNYFDLHEFIHYIDQFQQNITFKSWVDHADMIILQEIEKVINGEVAG